MEQETQRDVISQEEIDVDLLRSHQIKLNEKLKSLMYREALEQALLILDRQPLDHNDRAHKTALWQILN